MFHGVFLEYFRHLKMEKREPQLMQLTLLFQYVDGASGFLSSPNSVFFVAFVCLLAFWVFTYPL